MAKKKKSGPPYDYSKSENAYLLVVWCYGMDNDRPSERTQIDVDRAGTFIEAATGYLPNRIFTRKTEMVVIVELPKEVDFTPLYGAHRWSEFVESKYLKRHQVPNMTTFFEYNYVTHGPPERTWENEYPAEDYPDKAHIVASLKQPYPYPVRIRPSYARCPSRFGKELARDLFPPQVEISSTRTEEPVVKPEEQRGNLSEPPQPEPQVLLLDPPVKIEYQDPENHVANSPSKTDVFASEVTASAFRPYEPPSHHPAHAHYPDHVQGRPDPVKLEPPEHQEMSSSRAASSSKYDPYEEEEAAQLALRLPVTNIKQEDGIISAVPSCAVPVKQEDVYTPSSALVDYLRTRGSAVFNLPHEGSGHDRDISRAYAATNHAKQEQWDDSAALHPPDLNSTRKAPSTSVKLEPPEPSIPSSMSTRDPRRPSPPSTAVKLEPPQRSIPLSMSTRDPRRRPPSLVRVKTEEQELGEGNLGSSGRKDSMQRAPGNVEYDRKHATSLATLYGSHKRLKEEDVNRDTKRIKKEQE